VFQVHNVHRYSADTWVEDWFPTFVQSIAPNVQKESVQPSDL
jgi:hypothetical protein